MSSNAIQYRISFCVALQCVIKRRTFQGNHVLYHRGTVANHLQSGRISPVGNSVWWVLDWVWRVRSFAHISHHSAPLPPPFTPTSHSSGWQPSTQEMRHTFTPLTFNLLICLFLGTPLSQYKFINGQIKTHIYTKNFKYSGFCFSPSHALILSVRGRHRAV